MTRARLVTLLLTIVLTLSTASVVTAQDQSPAPSFDPSGIPEVNQDEALIAYLAMEDGLLAAGVAEEDIDAAVDWLAAEAANLSQADVDELLAGKALADSDAEAGDDEFGKAEGDEPEIGDEEDSGE